MTIQSFFPLTISSSLLESWNTCHTKGYRKYIQHLNSGRDSVHLIAGGAYAKGLEVMRKAFFIEGHSADYSQALGEEALIEAYGGFVPYLGDKDKKCLQNVINLYREYFNTFPLDSDAFTPVTLENGSKAVEFPFAIELPFKHPDLDIPLHFVGRFDMLVEFQGKIFGLDDKTKSGYPSAKQKEADAAYQYLISTGRGKGAEEVNWATRGQFSGYSWAMKQLGIPLDGFIIREAWFQSGSSWLHRQVYTPRRAAQVEMWGDQLFRQVEQMIASYVRVRDGEKTSKVFDMANDSALCVKYGSVCPFMELCTGELSEQYLGDRFEQSIWLPEETRRVSLEEYIDEITGGI